MPWTTCGVAGYRFRAPVEVCVARQTDDQIQVCVGDVGLALYGVGPDTDTAFAALRGRLTSLLCFARRHEFPPGAVEAEQFAREHLVSIEAGQPWGSER